MWLLRLLAIILAIFIGAGFLFYALTNNRYWLALSWRLLRWGIVFALILFALMIVERFALIPL